MNLTSLRLSSNNPQGVVSPVEELETASAFKKKYIYRDCQSMCDVHCRTAIIAENQLVCVWAHLHEVIMS